MRYLIVGPGGEKTYESMAHAQNPQVGRRRDRRVHLGVAGERYHDGPAQLVPGTGSRVDTSGR